MVGLRLRVVCWGLVDEFLCEMGGAEVGCQDNLLATCNSARGAWFDRVFLKPEQQTIRSLNICNVLCMDTYKPKPTADSLLGQDSPRTTPCVSTTHASR